MWLVNTQTPAIRAFRSQPYTDDNRTANLPHLCRERQRASSIQMLEICVALCIEHLAVDDSEKHY